MYCNECFFESFGTTQTLLIVFSVLFTSSNLEKFLVKINHKLLVVIFCQTPIIQLSQVIFIVLGLVSTNILCQAVQDKLGDTTASG